MQQYSAWRLEARIDVGVPSDVWHGMCVHFGMGALFNDPQADRLSKLLDVASLRAKVHASNLANQNTPGYKAKVVAFEDAFRAAIDEGRPVDEIEPQVLESQVGAVQPDGNNVSSEREVLEMGQNQSLYNAYVAMMQGRKKLMTIAITSTPS